MELMLGQTLIAVAVNWLAPIYKYFLMLISVESAHVFFCLLRVWLCSKSDLLLSACLAQHRSATRQQPLGSVQSVFCISCRPGSHDGSLALKPNAAGWRREPLEIGGEMGQVWISTPFADEKCFLFTTNNGDAVESCHLWVITRGCTGHTGGWPLSRAGKSSPSRWWTITVECRWWNLSVSVSPSTLVECYFISRRPGWTIGPCTERQQHEGFAVFLVSQWSLANGNIRHFKQQVMISTGFSPSFNSLCWVAIFDLSGAVHFFITFFNLVVLLLLFYAVPACVFSLQVKRLRFLCNLKGWQGQTGAHATVPNTGGFLFLTFVAVFRLAAALINSFILVL